MSTKELKAVVDRASPEERRWLGRYLWERECSEDPALLAELDRRMDDLDASKNGLSWDEAVQRLEKLDRQT